MKIKIGQRVKIRKDLIHREQYGLVSVVEEMLPLFGTYVVVDFIDYDNDFTIRNFPDNISFSTLMIDTQFKYGK